MCATNVQFPCVATEIKIFEHVKIRFLLVGCVLEVCGWLLCWTFELVTALDVLGWLLCWTF